MDPTPERFQALARSSPWRWSTLRYTASNRPGHGRFPRSARVWVRRPNLLRAEELGGRLVMVRREEPRTVATVRSDGGRTMHLRAAEAAVPLLDEDGLVRARPSRWEVDHDDPMFQNYYDVAMLDPVELADGRQGEPGTTVEDVRVVDHHGRATWQALVRPTATYDPRCPCCALLLSEESARLEGPNPRDVDPSFQFPDAHRVRLDLATGVCVYNEQLGGTRAGWGHDAEIDEVDAPMADDLFATHTRSRWRRSRRR